MFLLGDKCYQDRVVEVGMVQKLKDEIHVLSSQLANVDFTYNDPVKNFDRSRVKGVVAKLIKVKDSSSMTALEVGVMLDLLIILQPSRVIFSHEF